MMQWLQTLHLHHFEEKQTAFPIGAETGVGWAQRNLTMAQVRLSVLHFTMNIKRLLLTIMLLTIDVFFRNASPVKELNGTDILFTHCSRKRQALVMLSPTLGSVVPAIALRNQHN